MIRKILLALGAIIAGASHSHAQNTLTAGADAPPLYILEWLKGTPAPAFEKGKVYLVEFCYVACPPCRAAIPHLSAVSRRYKDGGKVQVISIFTSESNPDKPSDMDFLKRIKTLVERMGDKMDYTVAVDVAKQQTRAAWGNLQGFPQFFVVDQQGKIAFANGSFDELDYAIESLVKTGSYSKADFEDFWKKEKDSIFWHWEHFSQQCNVYTEGADLKAIVHRIDSALYNMPADQKEDFLTRKYVAQLGLEDSVAADKCLTQILANKKSGWENLHARFQYVIPPFVKRPMFNYARYLEIADKTIEELGVPYLQSVHLSIKATIMYACTTNKAASMAELEKALSLVKQTGISKDIAGVEDDIKRFKERY